MKRSVGLRFLATIPLIATVLIVGDVATGLGAGPDEAEAPSNWQPNPELLAATWLLVDDDDDDPDARAPYTATLDAMGVTYDVWTTGNSDVNEPTLATLNPYQTVVWFTGDEWGGFAGPSAASETVLGQWLDTQKCLFVSSQDYHFDKGLTPFMQNYLGAAAVTNDTGQASVTGAGSAFSYLGPYTLSYFFADFSDTLAPDGFSEPAFGGSSGTAGINKSSGYRTVFLGFPLEAIPYPDRKRALTTVFTYCNLDCPGTYNVDLNNQIVGGSPVYEACNAIGAGDDLTIAPGADVTLRAWHEVILRDGFTVGENATLIVGNARPD